MSNHSTQSRFDMPTAHEKNIQYVQAMVCIVIPLSLSSSFPPFFVFLFASLPFLPCLLLKAHRYSLFGSRSVSLGALSLGVDQLNRAIELYQLCAQVTPNEEQQVRQAIEIIVDGLKEKIRNIQAIHSIGTTQPSTLQARSDNTYTHSLPPHPRHSLPPPQLSQTASPSQSASTQSVSIPSSNRANPPSINTSISTTTVVNSHSRLSEGNSISALLVSSDPSHLRQVISSPAHFLQLVHIFLYAPHFLNKKMMNEHGHAHHYQQHDVSDYTRIQNVLQEMKQIADRLRTSNTATAITPSSASSSSQLPSKLDAQQADVQVRNLFHQYLRSIEPSRTGMTPQQIEFVHQQMNQLQTQYLDLLHSHSSSSSTSTLTSDPSMVSQLATDLAQRVRDVTHTLDHAQKQALAILREKQQHQQQGALTDGINAGAEHIQLLPFDSPSPHQSQPLASPSSNLATSPSSADSQIRALQKALHERERELKLERMARLKAEKSLAKNQERWRQLEEKVAAKKKAAQGSGQGPILTTTVGSTDASSPSPLSSSSSSPSSSAPGAPFLSGSTASIHVAKPVRVGNSPAK